MTSALSILDAGLGVLPNTRDQAVHDLGVDGRGATIESLMLALTEKHDQQAVDVGDLLRHVAVLSYPSYFGIQQARVSQAVGVGERKAVLFEEVLKRSNAIKQLEAIGHD